MVVNAVEVSVIMGAGMDSLAVDVVDVNVIMGAGTHSLVSCFAVNNSALAVVVDFYRCYDRGCARNKKMLRANRGGGVGRVSLLVYLNLSSLTATQALHHLRLEGRLLLPGEYLGSVSKTSDYLTIAYRVLPHHLLPAMNVKIW